MKNFVLLLLFVLPLFVAAQDNWQVPTAEQEKLSPYVFDNDMVKDGEVLYENFCISCHGTVTKNNPIVFVPSPGDPASEKFQSQPDGSIFYKISNGRGGMPSFAPTLEEEEIWSLIGYFRNFNREYVQPEFDYGDEVLSELAMVLSYDPNVDKLVVKVTSNGEPKSGIQVGAAVKGLFGKFILGNVGTNEKGLAWFDVDRNMPGDEEGNLTVQVRAQEGYSIKKAEEKMQLVNPTERTNLIAGRHLWSKAIKAPIWLIVVFNLVISCIWGIIIYIIIGLFRLKKVS
ncbi:c-type cytochrome [Draconibacterium sediminis]|uniref:c-type cytochrome n=1 Tax=Draconibacterium sediminis TaxID=1544798 RepID=UPI0005D3E706|nr:cytochrome c [Draconibacterium sediminis]